MTFQTQFTPYTPTKMRSTIDVSMRDAIKYDFILIDNQTHVRTIRDIKLDVSRDGVHGIVKLNKKIFRVTCSLGYEDEEWYISNEVKG